MMQFEIVQPSSAGTIMLGLVVALLMALALFFTWLTVSVPSVVITPDALQLKAVLYGRTIPRRELRAEGVRVMELDGRSELSPRFRTNGIGLPGFALGWFRLRNGEKALLALTARDRVVYVPTRLDYSLLLSVTDPDAFVRELTNIP